MRSMLAIGRSVVHGGSHGSDLQRNGIQSSGCRKLQRGVFLRPSVLLRGRGSPGLRAQADADTDQEESSFREEDSEKMKEDAEKDPVWIKREKMRDLQKTQESESLELPFYVSLPLSAVIAIAAVGSVFEFMNKSSIFGVIPPESPLWLPMLAFFALTGLPVSGYFFFSAVAAANKMAEQMDEVDKA